MQFLKRHIPSINTHSFFYCALFRREAGDAPVSKTDRRVRKSQEAIKTALIELMMEKDFDQITIQDISDRADVSRRTIYLHYMDKFDLLDKLMEEHIDEMRDLCEATDDDADYKDSALVWFEYLESHDLFFSAMLKSKGSLFFHHRLLEFFLQELGERDYDIPVGNSPQVAEGEEVDFQFLGSAIVGVVEWWFKHDKPYPPSFMAQRLGALLELNLRRILQP